MAIEVPVPEPAPQPITCEQRFAHIAQICGSALYSCTGRFEPLDDLELSSFAQQIKAQVDEILKDKRVTG